jgi:hypothetical protein
MHGARQVLYLCVFPLLRIVSIRRSNCKPLKLVGGIVFRCVISSYRK